MVFDRYGTCALKHLREYAIVIFTMALLAGILAVVSYNTHSRLKQAETARRDAVLSGRAYGEILWRLQSAHYWWGKITSEVRLSQAQGRQSSFDNSYQFFVQDLSDVLGNTHSFATLSPQARAKIMQVLSDAAAGREEILRRTVKPDDPLPVVFSQVERQMRDIASRVATFEYLIFDDVSVIQDTAQSVRWLLLIAFGSMLGVVGYGIFAYRSVLLSRAQAEKSRMEAIGLLSSGHSHAIASIITAMQFQLDILIKQTGARKAHYATIQAGLDQLNKLNTSLTMIARGGPVDEHYEPLNKSVAALMRLHRSAIDAGRLAIHNPPPTIGSLIVPSISLSLMLNECIANASRHVDIDGGKIDIRFSGRADRINCVIEDNGSGMDDALLLKATIPFFTTSGGSHLGLGLASNQAIAARLAGEIMLSNRPEGGLRVLITLPCRPSPMRRFENSVS